MKEPNTTDTGMQYEIKDSKSTTTLPATGFFPAANRLTPQEQEQARQARAVHIATVKWAAALVARRQRENVRAQQGRVAKRRKRGKVSKASRKRNRA